MKPSKIYPSQPHPILAVLGLSSILGLSIGFTDLIQGFIGKPVQFSHFSSLLLPLGAVTTAFFVLYALSWVFLSIVIRSLRTRPLLPSVLLALVIAILFLTLSWQGSFQLSISFASSLKLLLSGVSTLILVILIYWAGRGAGIAQNNSRTLENLLCSLPFLTAAAALFFWIMQYQKFLLSSLSTVLLAAVFLALALGIIILFVRFKGFREAARWPIVLMLLIVGMASWKGYLESRPAKIESPKTSSHSIRHVILLTVDTLRPAALSAYGPEGTRTPQIDQLAKEGHLFTEAFSPAPWTWPGVASMITGLSPTVLNLGYHVGRQGKLPDQVTTLAESMEAAGYRTAAIGRNAFLLPHSNVSQGFQEYDFFPKSMSSTLGTKILKRFWPGKFRSDATTTDLTELAVRWLKTHSDQDFFLWLHYFDPHDPYSPPERFLPEKKPVASIGKSFDAFTEVREGYLVLTQAEKDWIRELYLSEVRYVDHSIGKVVAELKKLGIYGETLIVFSSDHGEEMWEHGLIGHGHSVYQEMLHVPLIVKLPASLKETPRKFELPVSTVNILPTILDLTGVSYDAGHLSGSSLVPLWEKGIGAFSENRIVSTGLRYYEDRISLIAEGFQYIRFLETGKEELYDLEKDPLEQTSLRASAPERLAHAREMLAGYEKESDALRTYHHLTHGEAVELDKETLENLRSLGYAN